MKQKIEKKNGNFKHWKRRHLIWHLINLGNANKLIEKYTLKKKVWYNIYKSINLLVHFECK